jgi:endoglucanase
MFQELCVRDGRVVDTGNNGITHSEGQGYAMVMACAFRDRPVFDEIWAWTRTHLQTRPNDKLLSWLWKPGPSGGAIGDPNNASDGDLLVAWALLRAHTLWGDYAYQQSAAQILADLARLAVIERDGDLLLLPGVEGFVQDGEVTINPSYAIFPALGECHRAFPGGPWGRLSVDGARLVARSGFGKWKLVPDWVRVGSSVTPGDPPDFGYNAVRIPLYAAWESPVSPLTKPFAAFWAAMEKETFFPAVVNVLTDAPGRDPALPGMRAIAQWTIACASGKPLRVADIPPVARDEVYYSACLKILVKIAIHETRGGHS